MTGAVLGAATKEILCIYRPLVRLGKDVVGNGFNQTGCSFVT